MRSNMIYGAHMRPSDILKPYKRLQKNFIKVYNLCIKEMVNA
jgi:hypothetical protein